MSLMYENDNDNDNTTKSAPRGLPPLSKKGNAESQRNIGTPLESTNIPSDMGKAPIGEMPSSSTTASSTITNEAASSAGASGAVAASGEAVAGKTATAAAGASGGPIGMIAAATMSLLKKIKIENNNKSNNATTATLVIISVIIAVPLLMSLLASFLSFALLPGAVSSLYLGQYETSNTITEETEKNNDAETLRNLITRIIEGVKNNTIEMVNNFSRAFYDDTDIIGYENIAELEEFKKNDEFHDSYEANIKMLDEAMIQAYDYQKEQFIQWCDENSFNSEYALKSFPTFDTIGEIDYLTFLACAAQNQDNDLNNYTSKKFKDLLLSEESFQYLLSMEIRNVTVLENNETNISEQKGTTESALIDISNDKKIECDVILTPFTTSSLATLFGFSLTDKHYSTGISYQSSIEETKMMIQATCGDILTGSSISYPTTDTISNSENSTEVIDLKNYKTDVINDINNGFYTAEDYAYMVAVMSSEGSLSYECAVAVGYCVMYRCEVNHMTVKQVVTADNQFCSPWAKYIGKPVNQICATAAVAVLKGEAPNYVGDCYFFFSTSAVTCTKPGAYYKDIGGNLYYKKWGDVHTIHTSNHNCVKYKH